MIAHHDQHHRACVARLNDALVDYPRLAELGLVKMLALLPQIPMPAATRAAIWENGGGHANHTMFWSVMGGRGGAPRDKLARSIDRDFGSFEALRLKFNGAALAHAGDGWVFLTIDRTGALAVTTRENERSPWMDGEAVLFGNDLWRHAYAAKYQNRRADYLTAWWHVLNWPAIESRYALAILGNLAA